MKTLSPVALTHSSCRQRAAAVLLLLPLVLIMISAGSALAQTPPAVRPSASPTPTAGNNPAANQNPPATGSIKGRVVADDGRPLVNATLMAQAITGGVAIRPAH